jgi:hypothetical protein
LLLGVGMLPCNDGLRNDGRQGSGPSSSEVELLRDERELKDALLFLSVAASVLPEAKAAGIDGRRETAAIVPG